MDDALPPLHPLPERIETARLALRPWTVDDAPVLKALIDANLDHLRAWMPWAMNEPSPVEMIAERIEMFRGQRERGEDFGIGVLLGDEAIGGAGLHKRNGPGVLEIGYWMSAPHGGRGYATEAAVALIDVAFAMPGIERIEIQCDPRNVASAAVPRKLGFVHATTLQANTLTPTGEPRDTMVFEMTRSAWSSSRVDDAARTLGQKPGAIMRLIHVPLSRPALGGAALLVFVDCLKELPATLLLRPLNVETLSTYIYQYATRGNFEDGALAALLIVAAGIVPVIRMARYSDLALMPEAAPQ